MEPVLPMRETVDLRSYARLIWRRKWVVLVPAALAVLTAFVITLPVVMKPVYESSSVLMVEIPQPLSHDLASLVANPSVDEQLARLESMIQSNEFLTKMIATTGLREDAGVADWARKNQKRYPDLSLEDLVDLKLIGYLRKTIRMSAQPGRGRLSGNVIQVAVQDYYADRARRLVQNITAGIIEANRSEQLRQVKTTGDFSATQLQEYQSKVQNAEDRLEKYRRGQLQRQVHPGLIREENVGAARELRSGAATDLTQRQRETDEAIAAVRQAGGDPDRVLSALSDPGIAPLLNEARDLEKDYVRRTLLDLGNGGRTSQPTAIMGARKMEALAAAAHANLRGKADLPPEAGTAAEQYLLAVIRQDLGNLRVQTYDAELAEFTNLVNSIPQADLEFQRLQQELEAYKTLQNAFLQQLASSQISEAFGASKVGEKISILEPAQHPLSPIRPKRVQIILLALVAGLTMGMTAAFLLEQHDPSFKDVREMEGQLGLRVLGTLPHLRELENLARGRSRGAESPLRLAAVERTVDGFLADSPSYQELRKVVLGIFHPETNAPRTIMVTSTQKGEGKSTTAALLALTLAKERPQERIILVDLDLRNASLESFFGINGRGPEQGISLPLRRWEEEGLRELPLPNLRLLGFKGQSDAPPEILTADTVQWLLGCVSPLADRVIIDTPPNLPIPDALVIGQYADAVLLVVKAGATPRETVRRGLDLQRQFRNNIKGIIMNDCAEVLPYYYNPRYYGQGYTRHGSTRARRS